MEDPSRTPLLPDPVGPWGVSQDEVSPAPIEVPLGLSGGIGEDPIEPADQARPSLVPLLKPVVGVFCDNSTSVAYLKESGRYSLGVPQWRSPGFSSLGGGERGLSDSPVHLRVPEHRRRLSFSAEPSPLLGVDTFSSCLETIRRFARHEGFSRQVARQLGLARRQSTRRLYQHRWTVFREWCRKRGHSISRPSIPKVADFLLFLFKKRGLSVSSIRDTVLCFPLFSDLVSHSSPFFIQRPLPASRSPSWDLAKVLKALSVAPFEPLGSTSLWNLALKTLFLVSLATAKKGGELQAFSAIVPSSPGGLTLSYVPEFVAKTESISNPLPRSFLLRSLGDFVGDLPEELLLCPVRALSIYIKRTSYIKPRPRTLFVSPRCPTRGISKNAVLFLLRSLISSAGALGGDEGPSPKAHSIRAMATSVAFMKNWSLDRGLEAATCRTQSVFTPFYLKDVSSTLGDIHSLGPFVTSGQVVSP